MYQPFPGSAESQPEPALSNAPASVTRAARVMYVGAAASVIGIIVDLTTYSSLQNAIATRRRKNGQPLTHAQVVDLAHVEVVVLVVVGLIAIILLWQRTSSDYFKGAPRN
jgi:multisubunit Na+/H+ antiporter MnhB subunit